nr:uncharacterized protein LOC117280016 [Nicotiana tomentosiformis]
MVQDCLDYPRRCKAFQFQANFIHQPLEVLQSTVVSWPFDAWGLDVVGPLPKFFGGHLYILVAIDYFSKWAEGERCCPQGSKEGEHCKLHPSEYYLSLWHPLLHNNR